MASRSHTLKIRFEVDGDGNVKASLDGTEKGLRKVGGAAKESDSELRKFSSTMAALGAGALLGEAINKLVRTSAEFERLKTVLATVEGSVARAAVRFEELKDFAAATPFSLQQVVTAFNTLKARGLDPSAEALRAYGNVAAGMGRDIQQFIEAVGDAATGEMERLKEFGIIARQRGDEVAFTFRGVTTVVGRNARQIEGYLRGIGEVEFGGAMEAQSKTLLGALSNLNQAVDELANTFGEGGLNTALTATLGLMKGIVDRTATLLDLFSRGDNAFETFLGAYGTLLQLGNPFGGLTAQGLGAYAESENIQAGDLSMLGELRQSYDAVIAKVNEWRQASAEAMAEQEEAARKASEANAKLIDKLKDQVATYGLSKSAVLEYEKAQALATVADEKQREQIALLYDSLIAKTRADEAATEATRKATKEAEENARQERERADAIERMNRALAQRQDLLDRQVEAGNQLLGQLFPDIGISQNRDAELRTLREAFEAGGLTPEMFSQATQRVEADAARAAQDLARAQVDAYQAVWLNGIVDVSNIITDALLSGDWDDVGRRIAEALIGGYLEALLTTELIQPFQDAILAGGNPLDALRTVFQGRGFEMQPGFVGPPSALAGTGAGPGGFNLPGGATWGQAAGYGIGGAAIGGMVFGGSSANQAGGAIGGLAGGLFAGTAAGAGIIGAGLSAVGMGAALGSVVPIIGTIIGAVLGAALGELFEQKPELEVASTAGGIQRAGRVEGTASGAFGDIFVGKEDFDFNAQEFADQLAALDNALATMLTEAERAAAEAALQDFRVYQRNGENISPEEIISQRVDTIIAAVEPAFAGFLSGIEDVEDRLAAFEALRQFDDALQSLDDTISTLSGDPMDRFRAQLAKLDRAVTETSEALTLAIESQDPTQILQAAAAAEQAILQRYQAEIQMVQQLEAALIAAQQQSRQLDFALAQRIQATGGPAGLAAGVALANTRTLRDAVGSARTPEQGLAYLNEFVGTVDAWLQTALADAEALLNAERQRVATALAALDAERNGILSLAQERAAAEAQAIQQAAQAMQRFRAREMEALREQLALAEQFAGVVEQAQQLTRDLTFSSANPLGGFGRLGLLDQTIASQRTALGGASGSEAAAIAGDLLGLLQQRIGLIQSEGLFDRPSGDFLAIYNDTLRQIEEVRALAEPEADRAEALAERLNELQGETNSILTNRSSDALRLSADEQRRLEEIAAEEVTLREELAEAEQLAQETRDAINATAREYYEWAQTQAQQLEDARQQALLEQLEAITGGRPIDEFLADRAAETASLLTEIRDDLREFLDLISGEIGAGDGSTPIPGEPPGRGGGRIIPFAAPTVNASITVNVGAGAGGDGAAIGRAVTLEFERQIPQLATQLRRELGVA